MRWTSLIVSVAVAATEAMAICPGFNYGIGNQIPLGSGISRWNVYDGACNIVDGLTTNENPCDQNIFGCSPPPIIFNVYRSSITHLIYACRRDPNSGVCGNDVISVCCRNDGH